MGADEPAPIGGEGEIARGFSTARDDFNGREEAGAGGQSEDGETVVVAVGTVEEPAVGMDADFGARLEGGEIGGEAGDRLERSQRAGRGVVGEGFDRSPHFGIRIGVTTVGGEFEMAWAGAGCGGHVWGDTGCERGGGGVEGAFAEFRRGQGVGENPVETEIADDREAVIR